MELSATQSLPFQSSVVRHYLASYKDSLLAICAAQFGKKGFKDGVEVSAGHLIYPSHQFFASLLKQYSLI